MQSNTVVDVTEPRITSLSLSKEECYCLISARPWHLALKGNGRRHSSIGLIYAQIKPIKTKHTHDTPLCAELCPQIIHIYLENGVGHALIVLSCCTLDHVL